MYVQNVQFERKDLQLRDLSLVPRCGTYGFCGTCPFLECLGVERVTYDFLHLLRRLQRLARRDIPDIVPWNEELGEIVVALLLKQPAFLFVNKLNTTHTHELVHADMPKTTHKRRFVFLDTNVTRYDRRYREVGGNETGRAGELWGLVLLVHSETSFVADRLDEVDGKTFHRFVVQVLEHDMGVHRRVVQVEELVVEVLLVVLRIDVREDRCLARTGVAVQPDVWISAVHEKVTFLFLHRLETFAVQDEVPRVLREDGVVVYSFVEEVADVNEDFVDLTLFFELARFRDFGTLRGVLGQLALLKENTRSWVDFAELLDMVVAPSGVREITVPRHEIVTVSSLDTPILKDGGFADVVVEDSGDVDVLDLVVVLMGSCTDLNTSAQNVSKSSGVPVGTKPVEDAFEGSIFLDVEACVPLAVLKLVVDALGLGHGELASESAGNLFPM